MSYVNFAFFLNDDNSGSITLYLFTRIFFSITLLYLLPQVIFNFTLSSLLLTTFMLAFSIFNYIQEYRRESQTQNFVSMLYSSIILGFIEMKAMATLQAGLFFIDGFGFYIGTALFSLFNIYVVLLSDTDLRIEPKLLIIIAISLIIIALPHCPLIQPGIYWYVNDINWLFYITTAFGACAMLSFCTYYTSYEIERTALVSVASYISTIFLTTLFYAIPQILFNFNFISLGILLMSIVLASYFFNKRPIPGELCDIFMVISSTIIGFIAIKYLGVLMAMTAPTSGFTLFLRDGYGFYISSLVISFLNISNYFKKDYKDHSVTIKKGQSVTPIEFLNNITPQTYEMLRNMEPTARNNVIANKLNLTHDQKELLKSMFTQIERS
jgi:hypothetical protein